MNVSKMLRQHEMVFTALAKAANLRVAAKKALRQAAIDETEGAYESAAAWCEMAATAFRNADRHALRAAREAAKGFPVGL
jgi:hypothetical protein